jgi:hypothetical protein
MASREAAATFGNDADVPILSLVNREKRPWPDDEYSPWAGDPNPPTVFEVARMYPGRAVENAFVGVLAGVVVGGLIGAAIGGVVGSLVGVDVFKLVFLVVFLVVAPGFWWGSLYAEIHG